MMIRIFTTAFLFIYSISFAQYSDNIRSLSMGRTGTANSFNIDALNLNPANLSLIKPGDKTRVYLNAMTTGGYILNTKFLSIDFYNKYFTGDGNGNGKYLTDADKRDILAKAKDSHFGAGVGYKFASVVFKIPDAGVAGFSIEDKIFSSGYLPNDLLQLSLFGNEVNKRYDFSNYHTELSWIRQLNFSFARSTQGFMNGLFENFSYGVAVKPQMGYYYIGVDKNDLNFHTNDSNQITSRGAVSFLSASINSNDKFEYPALGKLAGFGMGFDIGFNAKVNNNLSLGLAVIDIGYVNWYANTYEYKYEGDFVITDLAKKEQLDTLRSLLERQKISVSGFQKSLPTTLRFGLSYKFFKNELGVKGETVSKEFANVNLDLIQGLVKNTAGTITKPVIGLGAEFFISDFFIPRIGFIGGGAEEFVVSMGVGLDTKYVAVDIGTHNIGALADLNNTSKISGGLNIKIKL